MRSRRNLTVVKLGGSHAYAAHLRPLLREIARDAGRVVLVPGGGPFADAVRAAQPRMLFDDAAAHHMALLAMEQFGRALMSLNPVLERASSLAAIRSLLRRCRVPVWAPSTMVLCARDIPASWDVTSDSLAAWLAVRTRAARLVLIKHSGVAAADSLQTEDLVKAGIVDPALPRFLLEGGVEAAMLAPSEYVSSGRGGPDHPACGRRIAVR